MANTIQIGTVATIDTNESVSVNGTQVAPAVSTTSGSTSTGTGSTAPAPAPAPAPSTSTAVLKDSSGNTLASATQGSYGIDNTSGLFLKYFRDGGVVLFGNNLVTATADLVLTGVTLTVNGKVLFTGDLTIPPGSSKAIVVAQPTFSTVDPSKVFKHGTGTPNWLAAFQASPSPNKLYNHLFATTGERPDLGPETEWDTAYLLNPISDNAQVIFGQALAFADCPIQAIDPATGDLISLATYPKASMIDGQRGATGNPFPKLTQTSSIWKLTEVAAHAPEVGYIATLATNSDYCKWICEAWALYISALWIGSGYRLNSGNGPSMAIHNQDRGEAWMLRSLVQAASINGPHSAIFSDYANQVIAELTAYCNAWPNRIHVPLWQTGYMVAGGQGVGSSQCDFLVIALGLAAKLGFDVSVPLAYFGQLVIDRFNNPAWWMATGYDYRVQNPDGTYVKDWQEALTLTANNDTTFASELANTSATTFYGYPTSPDGHVAVAWAALAPCVTAGLPGAQQAWSVLQAHQTIDWTAYRYNVLP